MNTPMTNRYQHHRFPVEIISHAVRLYFRFCLSYYDVEELLFARGVTVTYEAIRRWCRKFGQAYANQLRRRRLRPGDKWHLDEVSLAINRKRHYLWRAVDQDGTVLDILGQRRRNTTAAKRFFRKLLKGCQYVPRVSLTDKLKRYGVAKQELLPSVGHRQHRYVNNRAETSRQPTRQRERRMRGVQVTGTRPTLSLRAWSHRPTLPPKASPVVRPRVLSRDGGMIPHLAGHHEPSHRCISVTIQAVV
jgi:putative transposase